MADIYETWIKGKRSIVALIDSSKVFSTKFAEFVEKDTAGFQGIRNMSWANHRHEAMAKPLARSCLCILAQMALAAWIVTVRTADDAKGALRFLDWLNEERYLQACMMGDATDEIMGLLRFTDNEEMDVDETVKHVSSNQKHLYYLFGPAMGCTQVQGFTKFGLQLLQQPHYFNVKGNMYACGGPGNVTPSMLRACLARMKPWLVLADCVVETEFPSFDVCMAFSVFSLQDLRQVDLDAEGERCLRRLAAAFRVDAEPSLGQFQYVRPIALNIFLETGCCSKAAWAEALRRVLLSSQARPVGDLQTIMVEKTSFLGTTAAVEQGFALSRAVIKPQQGGVSETMDIVVCKLVMDRTKLEEQEVLQGARRAWALTYGEVRTPTKARLTKGCRGKQRTSNTSLVAFLRARRAAVKEAAVGIETDIKGLKRKLEVGGKLSTRVLDEIQFQETRIANKR